MTDADKCALAMGFNSLDELRCKMVKITEAMPLAACDRDHWVCLAYTLARAIAQQKVRYLPENRKVSGG